MTRDDTRDPPNDAGAEPGAPELSISTEKICYVIVKGRELDVKDVVTEPDPGSNAADDGMVSVLEDHADDPTLQELVTFLTGLNEDEQIDLVALMWLGRGDGTLEDWDTLHEEAAGAHNARTPAYLLGNPLLADHLEDGLSQLGQSCEDFEMGHL